MPCVSSSDDDEASSVGPLTSKAMDNHAEAQESDSDASVVQVFPADSASNVASAPSGSALSAVLSLTERLNSFAKLEKEGTNVKWVCKIGGCKAEGYNGTIDLDGQFDDHLNLDEEGQGVAPRRSGRSRGLSDKFRAMLAQLKGND